MVDAKITPPYSSGLHVTSFLSIACLSKSEHWSQKTSQNGSIHSIHKMSMIQALLLHSSNQSINMALFQKFLSLYNFCNEY